MRSVLFVAVLSAACGKSGPEVGAERGACYGNGTCDEGLVCRSGLCVAPLIADEGDRGPKAETSTPPPSAIPTPAPSEDRDTVPTSSVTANGHEAARADGDKLTEKERIRREVRAAVRDTEDATVAGFIAVMLSAMDGYADDVCDCPTMDCAKKVMEELGERSYDVAFTYTSTRVVTDELAVFMSELEEKPGALATFVKSNHPSWWSEFNQRLKRCGARFIKQ